MTKALFSKLMAAILACAVFTLVLFSCSMTANAAAVQANRCAPHRKIAAVQRMSLQEESFIRSTGFVSASVTPPAAVCNGTCPPARKAPLYAAQHISEAII